MTLGRKGQSDNNNSLRNSTSYKKLTRWATPLALGLQTGVTLSLCNAEGWSKQGTCLTTFNFAVLGGTRPPNRKISKTPSDTFQRGGAWAGCGPAQSCTCCTKCNSPPINGQCTNFILFDVAPYLPLHSEGLITYSS